MGSISDATAFMGRSWSDIEPYYRDLEARPLHAGTVDSFLTDWTWVAERVDETYRRLEVATTQNTADTSLGDRFHTFLDEVYPRAQEAEQALREKFLRSGLEPAGLGVPLRKMRITAELYRRENLPLLAEEKRLSDEYFSITGAQTVQWEGGEIPLAALAPVGDEVDRSRRERAWRQAAERRLADRDAVTTTWRKLLAVRERLAANAGLRDYRSYRWRQMVRLDYTPEDAKRFDRAVEEVVVPAARRLAERRRRQLGVESLRPWDLRVDPTGRPPLRPFGTIDELTAGMSAVFRDVDPALGAHFDLLRAEDLLDLDVRTNKAPIGYCLPFNAARRPFIFLSCAGSHGDVTGLLHEGGHAFHVLEMAHLPYLPQRDIERMTTEFAEVGSTAMEYLALPSLCVFYDEVDVARATVQQLEGDIRGWCRIALVDVFQHWVYEHPHLARDPDHCDATFLELAQRFDPGVDYSGLERFQMSGWRSVPHIHESPFYFLEYGLATLGAVQIWIRALQNQEAAVRRYRAALYLGETRTVPELFEAAGARFALDAATLRTAVETMEATIDRLSC